MDNSNEKTINNNDDDDEKSLLLNKSKSSTLNDLLVEHEYANNNNNNNYENYNDDDENGSNNNINKNYKIINNVENDYMNDGDNNEDDEGGDDDDVDDEDDEDDDDDDDEDVDFVDDCNENDENKYINMMRKEYIYKNNTNYTIIGNENYETYYSNINENKINRTEGNDNDEYDENNEEEKMFISKNDYNLLINRINKANQQVFDLNKYVNLLKNDKKTLNNELNHVKSKNNQLSFNNKELNNALIKLGQDKDDLIKEINNLNAARLKAINETKRYKHEFDELKREYTQIMSERDSVHKEIEALQEKLCKEQDKIKMLQSNNYIEIEKIKNDLDTVIDERDKMVVQLLNINTKNNGDQSFNQNFSQYTQNTTTTAATTGIELIINNSNEETDADHSNNLSSIFNYDKYIVSKEEKLIQENEKLKHDLKELEQDIETAKRRRDLAFNERDKMVKERESIRGLCDVLRHQRDKAISELAESLRESDELKKQKTMAIRQIHILEDQISVLEEKLSIAINQYNRGNWETLSVNIDIEENENVDLGITFSTAPIQSLSSSSLHASSSKIAHEQNNQSKEISNDSNKNYLLVSCVSKTGLAYGKLKENDRVLCINNIDTRDIEIGTINEIIKTSKGVIRFVISRHINANNCDNNVTNNDQTESRTISEAFANVNERLISIHKTTMNDLLLESGVFVAAVNPESEANDCLDIGDRILSINGIQLTNKTLMDVLQLVRDQQHNDYNLIVLKTFSAGLTVANLAASPNVDYYNNYNNNDSLSLSNVSKHSYKILYSKQENIDSLRSLSSNNTNTIRSSKLNSARETMNKNNIINRSTSNKRYSILSNEIFNNSICSSSNNSYKNYVESFLLSHDTLDYMNHNQYQNQQQPQNSVLLKKKSNYSNKKNTNTINNYYFYGDKYENDDGGDDDEQNNDDDDEANLAVKQLDDLLDNIQLNESQKYNELEHDEIRKCQIGTWPKYKKENSLNKKIINKKINEAVKKQQEYDTELINSTNRSNKSKHDGIYKKVNIGNIGENNNDTNVTKVRKSIFNELINEKHNENNFYKLFKNKSELESNDSNKNLWNENKPFNQTSINNEKNSLTNISPPLNGDVRLITINKKPNDVLGINIVEKHINENGNNGVFVSNVLKSSLAHKAGIHVGDQLLEICGLNLRSANYKEAAKVLSDSSGNNSIKLLVQYNINKYNNVVPLNTSTIKSSNSLSSMNYIKETSNFGKDINNDEIIDHSNNELNRSILLDDNYDGLKIIGGMSNGIFVDEMPTNCSLLRKGDQLLQWNDYDLNNVTFEKASYELFHSDKKKTSENTQVVNVIARYELNKYKNLNRMQPDSFFIICLNDYESKNENELELRKFDVLHVINTLPNGVVDGYWKACLIYRENHQNNNNKKKQLDGFIPSITKFKNDLINKSNSNYNNNEYNNLTSTKLSKQSDITETSLLFDKTNNEFEDQFQLIDLSSIIKSLNKNELQEPLTYKLIECIDKGLKRPCIILGPLSTCICDYLENEKDTLFVRIKKLMANNENITNQLEYSLSSQLYDENISLIKQIIINKNMHPLIDNLINTKIIDDLKKSKLYPIIIWVKYKSFKHIIGVNNSIVGNSYKLNAKQAKEMYQTTSKREKQYKSYITNYIDVLNDFKTTIEIIKQTIFAEQKKLIWIPSSISNKNLLI